MNALPIVLLLAAVPAAASAECQVTLPSSSPVVVPNDSPASSHAWYGSDALAVRLPVDGIWRGMGAGYQYRDKLWFWRRGYSAAAESEPALTLDGVKLDEDTREQIHVGEATNAFGKGWARMLTGLEFPSAGCWRVTAAYLHEGIREELTFVVRVVDPAELATHGRKVDAKHQTVVLD